MNTELDTHDHICLLKLLWRYKILKRNGYKFKELCPQRKYMTEKGIQDTTKNRWDLSVKCDFCDFCRYMTTIGFYHDNIKLSIDEDVVETIDGRKEKIKEIYRDSDIDFNFIKNMET